MHIIHHPPRAPASTQEAVVLRTTLLLLSLLFAATLEHCLGTYAAVQWSEYGFSYAAPDGLRRLAVFATLLAWCAVLPKQIDRPSSLFLVVVYAFICVPATVALACLDDDLRAFQSGILAVLAIGFWLTCLVVAAFAPSRPAAVTRGFTPRFVRGMAIAWGACLLFLLYSFGDVMRFESLDTIYLQREIGKADDLLSGYAQTYFGYVLSPALLVFGLYRRKLWPIVAGFSGAIVLFMITAEKAAFMYPFFIVAIAVAMRLRPKIFTSSAFVILAITTALMASLAFLHVSRVAEFVAWYLGTRTLLMPGIFIAHYWDFFSSTGFTHWAQIRGLDMLTGAAPPLVADPRWPSLGLIVGEDQLGVLTMNANANFIASDGVASLGLPGIGVALALLCGFLLLLDRVSRGLDPRFVVPLLVPLALTLTNGSLFTAMTSFGGLFWIVCFALLARRFTRYSPRRAHAPA